MGPVMVFIVWQVVGAVAAEGAERATRRGLALIEEKGHNVHPVVVEWAPVVAGGVAGSVSGLGAPGVLKAGSTVAARSTKKIVVQHITRSTARAVVSHGGKKLTNRGLDTIDREVPRVVREWAPGLVGAVAKAGLVPDLACLRGAVDTAAGEAAEKAAETAAEVGGEMLEVILCIGKGVAKSVAEEVASHAAEDATEKMIVWVEKDGWTVPEAVQGWTPIVVRGAARSLFGIPGVVRAEEQSASSAQSKDSSTRAQE